MKITKKVALIFFSIIGIVIFIEILSGVILKLHSINLNKKTQAFTEAKFESSGSEVLVENSRYSSENLMKEMNKLSEASEYTSYLIFKFNPINSELVNIGEDGYRLNDNSVVEKDNVEKFKIWIIGGTEAFGYVNSDAETMSSLLEEKLNNKHSQYQFEVENHGVFGYSSTQQLIRFRLDLIEKKPDMIIVMNGFNDYKISWKYQSIYATDLYTHIYLKKYWNNHKNNSFFDWELFYQHIKNTFSNTSLLAYLGKKWFYLKYYQTNIAYWKEKYKNRSAYEKKINLEGLKKSTNLYIENMSEIASLAKRHNIKVVFSQTPLLFETNKKLIAHETTDYVHIKLGFFALSDDEVDQLDHVPSHEILRIWHWNFNDFVKGYRLQEKKLEKLCNEISVSFHDFSHDIEKNPNIPVFENFANITYRGNEILANSLLPKINNFLKNEKINSN